MVAWPSKLSMNKLNKNQGTEMQILSLLILQMKLKNSLESGLLLEKHLKTEISTINSICLVFVVCMTTRLVKIPMNCEFLSVSI